VTPDAATLIVAGEARSDLTNDVTIWDVASGSLLATIKTGVTDQSVYVTSVAISPNGATFALGFSDGKVQLWDLASGTRLATYTGNPTTEVRDGLAFSPDGTLIGIGDSGGTITVLDVASWEPVGNQLKEQVNEISTIVFSADNSKLISGDFASVVVWRLADERPIATVEGATSAAFSPDGNTMITVGGSIDNGLPGSVQVWDLQLDAWRTAACQVAGRNLTQEEWSRYLPDADYRTTCS
jgi:WD40 repeat protein